MITAAAAMSGDGLHVVALGATRVVGYAGLVLLIGTTFFLAWLWPTGHPIVRIFDRLLDIGVALTLIGSVAGPYLKYDDGWSSYAGREGALTLARMALAALAYACAKDVLSSARQLRPAILVWQLLMIQTFVLTSNAWGGPWAPVKIIATTGHVAATAAWLGGLVVLAAVLIPGRALDALHDVLPRFSSVAIVSVVTLVITGTVHALAIAGGVGALVDSTYGIVLGIKLLVFGAMLLLGNFGRRYAERIGRRKITAIDDSAPPETVQAFAVAIGAELAVAIGVLAATAALVHVAPGH